MKLSTVQKYFNCPDLDHFMAPIAFISVYAEDDRTNQYADYLRLKKWVIRKEGN